MKGGHTEWRIQMATIVYIQAIAEHHTGSSQSRLLLS